MDDAERVWIESMAVAYEEKLVPAMFAPFARDLASRVAAVRPAHVLELAAGTGVLTRELVHAVPDATIVATDLNQAMVETGSRLVPGPSWRPADAARLPFPDGQFDLVVCQFGVMFFPDKPAAHREVSRVLVPGGRFLLSTWATVDQHDFAAALTAGLERAFPGDPPTFVSDIPHGYDDPDVVVADLRAGGFESIRHESVVLEGSASARDVAVGFCLGTPLRAGIEERGDLAEAVEIVTREMEARLGTRTATAHMAAHVFDAVGAT